MPMMKDWYKLGPEILHHSTKDMRHAEDRIISSFDSHHPLNSLVIVHDNIHFDRRKSCGLRRTTI